VIAEAVLQDVARTHAGGPLASALHTCRTTARSTVRIFASLWGQPGFYRFLLFMLLVVGVRMIFYHFNYTLPDFAMMLAT
jgi:hypothetical protein